MSCFHLTMEDDTGLNTISILLECPIDFASLCYLNPMLENGLDNEQLCSINGLTLLENSVKKDNMDSNLNINCNDSESFFLLGEPGCVRFRVPNFNLINVDHLDVILISNLDSIGALPYLTEYMEYKVIEKKKYYK